MDLESKLFEIKAYLSISEEDFNLRNKIDNYFDSDDTKIEILSKIILFIYNFSMFKKIQPFMHSVYNCIEKTLELKIETINDFNELLIKNTIMHFIQHYIDYAQLTQKRQILKLLSDSLDRLQIQPLIINLGLLLKPMYQDQNYLDQLKYIEEVEITYDSKDQIEIQIKSSVDNWFSSQQIDLDNQNELKSQLKEYYNELAKNYNLSIESDNYQRILGEIMEMLTMKLTMVSLMDSMADESFEPIPIK